MKLPRAQRTDKSIGSASWMKSSLSGYFALLFIFFSLSALPLVAKAETSSFEIGDCQPKVIKGEIDLRCWRGETLDLAGEWLFSWSPVRETDAKAVGEAPEFTEIPGGWRYIDFKGGKGPTHGVARYRARLHFDEQQKGLVLYPGSGNTSYQVLLKDRLGNETVVYDNRLEDGTEIIPSAFVPLPDLAEEVELVLIVTNQIHYSGSIERAPQIGTVLSLVHSQFLSKTLAVILFGGYIFFGLYNLILALGYRKDLMFVVLAFACFIFATRILVTEDLITVFWSVAPLHLIWNMGWVTFFCLGLIWPIYVWMRYSTAITLNFARISVGLSLTGLILVATTGPYIFIEYGVWYRFVYLLALLIMVPYILYLSLKGKLPGYTGDISGKVTVITLMIAVTASVVDMIYYATDQHPLIDNTSLAFFVLIAGQSFIVAKGYTKGLEKEVELTSELKALNQRLEEEVGFRTEELMEANGLLEQMARTDQLTGLPNRRAFEESMIREIERFDRTALPLSLFVLDADHFKLINDNYGHDIGDIVLKHLADIISQEARIIDLPSRIGGEEFAVLLTQTDMDGAMMLAERIRSEVEKAIIITGGEEIRFTISGGIACYHKGMKSQLFFKNADKGLYEAKEGGRNKIILQTKS